MTAIDVKGITPQRPIAETPAGSGNAGMARTAQEGPKGTMPRPFCHPLLDTR